MFFSLQIDSLHYVREKATSRKAQLLSAECSTSNSPEFPHFPHNEIHVGQSQHRPRQPTIAEAARKKMKSCAGAEKDFNKTFTAGESLAHLHPSVTTWQTLQSLTQTAPAAPVAEKPRKKKKKRKEGSDEGGGSSDGSDLAVSDRGDALTFNKHSVDHPRQRSEPPPSREQKKQKKLKRLEGSLPTMKAGARRAGSLGLEGQRPSIERGGTNMIMMEVNGIKSPPPLPLPEQQEHVSPIMRETRETHGKKQRKSEPAFAFKETTEASGLSTKWDVPDLQPLLNADRGLLESLNQLDNSDWKEKCEGLMGVRRLAMFHVEKLVPELHTITLAVVQEVKPLSLHVHVHVQYVYVHVCTRMCSTHVHVRVHVIVVS